MSELSAARNLMQEEELSYKAAVSESTFTRMGQAMNHIMRKQYDMKVFNLNGPYNTVVGAQSGFMDGVHGMLFDMSIVGVLMFNETAGSSGTTTLDIRRRTASGDATGTSIFSTKPSITSAAGNFAYVFVNLESGTPVILENPAGTTVPVVSVSDIDQGDILSMNVDAKQPGGENAGIILFMRPR